MKTGRTEDGCGDGGREEEEEDAGSREDRGREERRTRWDEQVRDAKGSFVMGVLRRDEDGIDDNI